MFLLKPKKIKVCIHAQFLSVSRGFIKIELLFFFLKRIVDASIEA